ncbi:MAG: 23S rRNA (guanosine(2251)-2'-O)-methyltransferase RlmB [Dongiaceae bacterium]
MNKRKPPTRGRERGSGRSRDFPQDQRHRSHRSDPARTSDRGGAAPRRGHQEEPRREAPQPGGPYWLYGHHAVTAALDNPERKILRLAHTGAGSAPAVEGHDWEQVPRDVLESWLPPGAVHQGLAAKVHPLPDRGIEDVIAEAETMDSAHVMILDQVTDPQNVGAILRSAAAFGALAVILTERHAAPESGALAKAASGALEHVPLVRVANLARALELLKKGGFWIAGLAAEASQTLAQAKLTGKVGLALGAEGPGLRRLTRDHCDLLVRLPTGGPIDHLNVSNAAAVALYELVRERGERA